MTFFIKTHIVKKGETLEKIALQYQIPNVDILRNFHNQNVPKNQNHIGMEITEGQEIFIPQKEDIDRVLERQKIMRDQRNENLRNQTIRPTVSQYNHYYQTIITECYQEKEEKISIELELEYLSSQNLLNPILKYDKKEIKVNDDIPNLKVYDLAHKCSSFIYPLEFEINKENIVSIAYPRELLKTWERKKQEILEEYNDLYAAKYIEQMDYQIRKNMDCILHKDLFLQFLFTPYGNYIEGENHRNKLYGNTLYQDTLSIEEINDTIINIRQHAKSNNDEQSEIVAYYTLDMSNKIVNNADIRISSMHYGKKKIIEIKIKKNNM